MALCTSCRLALRRSLSLSLSTTTTTTTRSLSRRTLSTKPPTTTTAAAAILSKPTWSVRSLLPSSSTTTEPITPSQLHHLLRLAALPLPSTPAAEASMLATLQSQLQFVRAVQRVDTAVIEPLRAIRDESLAAREQAAVTLKDLEGVLAAEKLVGHYRRPKRVRDKVVVEPEAEAWDALGTASRTAGRYFVVRSGKKQVEASD